MFLTKTALFAHFWARILLPYLKSGHSNLSHCKILRPPPPPHAKFGTKNALFEYFWAGILKSYCLIWKQHLWICLIAKFYKETKMPKFRNQKCHFWVFLTKNALFIYFWARILKILLPDLKSAPSNLSICKISWKNKNASIWH